jgi:hypothetical protein
MSKCAIAVLPEHAAVPYSAPMTRIQKMSYVALCLAASSAWLNVAPRGTLLIVGGGPQPPALVEQFVELAGGRGKAKIAIFAEAALEPNNPVVRARPRCDEHTNARAARRQHVRPANRQSNAALTRASLFLGAHRERAA